MISGVCRGFARYFGLDVTLLRVIAVLLLFVSGGAMILVYLILMLLLPYAPPEPGSAPIRTIPARTRSSRGLCARSSAPSRADAIKRELRRSWLDCSH